LSYLTFSTVTGSISPSFQTNGVQGYTSFDWTASNPSPSNECGGVTPVTFTFSGTIQNDGDDLGPNTSWTNVTGEHGTTTITKSPSDLPASETTNAVGFSSGYYVTVGQFRQVLNMASGSTDVLKGRQVSEYTGFGTNYDTCWYTGSMVSKFNSVTGSLWNVGYYAIDPPFITSLNEWADDFIGWATPSVDYYRSHGRVSPACGARVPQARYIATGGTSGTSENYGNGTLGEDIYATTVTAVRNGVIQTATYVTKK
jgi:hypothetical protein